MRHEFRGGRPLDNLSPVHDRYVIGQPRRQGKVVRDDDACQSKPLTQIEQEVR